MSSGVAQLPDETREGAFVRQRSAFRDRVTADGSHLGT